MKKIISCMLTFAMLLTLIGTPSAFAEREYAAEVSILGNVVDFKNQPYSEYNTVFVPIEELCGYLGITVEKADDTAVISRMGTSVKLQVGNLICEAEGREYSLPSHPVEKNGQLYVPVEVFLIGFGCPVTISEDKRSADITPNVYVLRTNEQNAAAISGANPDADTLVTGTAASDSMWWNTENFPQLSTATYYKFDLSAYKGMQIESASLNIYAARTSGAYNPRLRAIRTDVWEKGAISFSKQPTEYEASAQAAVADSAVKLKELDVSALVKNAMKSENVFSAKVILEPTAARMDRNQVQGSVKGVNTTQAPTLSLTVKESYTFPVKTAINGEKGDEQRYNTLALLKTLSVFTEDDEFPINMEEGVTRGEFVTFVLRLRNDKDISGGTQHYTDVKTDNPYFGAVSKAHEYGYIMGDGVTFRPYDHITVGEAITILGRMMNYNIYADERGGFTPGYMSAARQGDLYIGGLNENTVLSFNEMIEIFENALDASMLDIVSYKTDGSAEYIFNENKTILTEYWNATKIEGTVTANEYSAITAPFTGSDGSITIGTKKLDLIYDGYNSLLGYDVKGYYDDENTLLYIGTKNTSSVTVNMGAIEAVEESSAQMTVNYQTENGKIKSESFSKNATVIYNGKYVEPSNVSAALLSADCGSVVKVGEKLVIISAYKTVIVQAADANEEIIYDYYEPYDNLLSLKGKEWTLSDVSGKQVKMESLKKYDVISAAVSLDGELINCVLSTRKENGAITLLENEGTADEVITVGGNEYKTANRNTKWTSYIQLGANGTFLIDFAGNIVAIIVQDKTDVLGYLLTVDYAGSSLRKKLQAAIVTEDAEEYVVYNLADKVEIDGEKVNNHEDIKAYFTETVEVEDSSGEIVDSYEQIKKQPVIFDLNAEGKINSIDTSVVGEDENGETTLRSRYTMDDPQLSYKSSGACGGQFFIGKEGGMIIAKGGEEFEDYIVRTSLSNDTKYSIDIYTIGTETPEAIFALVEQATTTPSIEDNELLYLVDRVVVAYDSDGCEVKKLYYYSGVDSLKSVIVDDKYEHLVTDLDRGDIIRFSTNAHGELHAVQEYYDYTSKSFIEGVGIGTFNAMYRVSAGYVTKINKTYVQISNDEDLSAPASHTWHDASRFSNLMSYEVSSAGIAVKKETVDSIRSYKSVPFNPHGLIMATARENYRSNVWLVELTQPENTGIYTVSYGGGAENVTGVPEGFTRYNPGDEVVVTDAVPTRADHDFKGWLLNGDVKFAGETFIVNGNIQLVAQWAYNPTYDFYFVDENEEVSAITRPWPLTDTEGNTVARTLPTADDFKKNGYALTGWNLGGTPYPAGGSYTPNPVTDAGGRTFIAIWQKCWTGGISASLETDTDGYYKISSGEDLAKFSEMVKTTPNINARLTEDIYLNFFGVTGEDSWYADTANIAKANNWADFAIGASSAFTGTFDGNGKTIYNLYSSGNKPGGLFSSVNGATLKNFTVANAYVVSNYESNNRDSLVSVICGQTSGTATLLSEITAKGTITVGQGCYANRAGAIVANMTGGTIRNCNSYVYIDLRNAGQSVTSDDTMGSNNQYGIGGIAGALRGDAPLVIENCANYGDIDAYYAPIAGGIAGSFYSDSQVKDSSGYSIRNNINQGEIVSARYVHETVAARKNRGDENSALTAIRELNDINDTQGSATVYTPVQP